MNSQATEITGLRVEITQLKVESRNALVDLRGEFEYEIEDNKTMIDELRTELNDS